MDIHLIPEDPEKIIKTNEQSEIKTAQEQDIYTKEDMQKLIEKMMKNFKESEEK